MPLTVLPCLPQSIAEDTRLEETSPSPECRAWQRCVPDFTSEEMGEASFFSQFKMLFSQRVSPSAFLSIPTQFIERSFPCPSFFSSITLQYWRLLPTPCEVQGRMCHQKVSSMAVQSAGCPWWVWTTAASPHEHFLENPYHLQLTQHWTQASHSVK